MRFYLILFLSFIPLSALAEEMHYDEQVDRAALSEDLNDFLDRENTCFVINDQPQPWDEDQKQALAEAKCEELGCVRQNLLKKYTGSETQKVITDYNSSLWKFDFSAFYDGQDNACKE